MTPTHALYDLPISRRAYGVRRRNSTPGSQECIICYRTFDVKDDPSDPTEIPCSAVELQPCQHTVGSECLKTLVRAGMDTCQLCRTKLSVITNPFPRWIQYIISLAWFDLHCDMARAIAVRDDMAWQFDYLSSRLLQGTITQQDALTLWSYYIKVPRTYTWRLVSIVFHMYAVTAGLAKLSGTTFVELYALKILGIHSFPDEPVYAFGCFAALTAALCFIVAKRMNTTGRVEPWLALSFLWAVVRALEVLVGIKGVLSLLILNWIAFAFVSGVLIGYGVCNPPVVPA